MVHCKKKKLSKLLWACFANSTNSSKISIIQVSVIDSACQNLKFANIFAVCHVAYLFLSSLHYFSSLGT